MRERRRLGLATRQALHATIARREAMAALADANEEEQRTAALAERSRDLLREYSARCGHADGATLRDRSAFSASLGSVAAQADHAFLDAREQAAWQISALAAAETRATRLEDRRDSARRALRAALEKRDFGKGEGVARKLHCTMPTPVEEAEASRPARRKRTRQ